MASPKQTPVRPGEWWKHMDFMKRVFWKRVRQESKREAKQWSPR